MMRIKQNEVLKRQRNPPLPLPPPLLLPRPLPLPLPLPSCPIPRPPSSSLWKLNMLIFIFSAFTSRGGPFCTWSCSIMTSNTCNTTTMTIIMLIRCRGTDMIIFQIKLILELPCKFLVMTALCKGISYWRLCSSFPLFPFIQSEHHGLFLLPPLSSILSTSWMPVIPVLMTHFLEEFLCSRLVLNRDSFNYCRSHGYISIRLQSKQKCRTFTIK